MISVLVTAVVGISGVWVYLDATGHKIGKVPGTGGMLNMSAGAWGTVTLFFWIIGFPAYLLKRRTLLYRAKDHPVEVKGRWFKALILAAIGGLLLLWFLGSAINTPDDADYYKDRRFTPLMVAAYEGDTEKVRDLLSQGADVNAKDNHGETALMMAAHWGHIDIVRILLERGADANAKDNTGNTVLIYATSTFQPDPDIVQVLFEKGADVNAKDDSGFTALFFAAYLRSTDIVRLYLEKGADVNAKTNGGLTALMAAARYGASDNVRTLLEKGADVNAKDNQGETALMNAKKMGNNEIVQMLRQAGAKE